MFNFVKSFLGIKTYDEQFKCGYDWAAGALLRGEETPQSIDDHVFYERSPFDIGAAKAAQLLINLGVVEDDYI